MSESKERLAEVATEIRQRVDLTLRELWWAMLLRGVLAVIVALCLFIWPQKTMNIMIMLLGAYFLIDGLVSAFGAYRSGDRGPGFVQPLVCLAIGLVLLIWSGISAKIFLILVGIWLLLQAISLFISSRKIDPAEGERGLATVVAIVIALIGIVFVFWTETGVVAISWLIGIGSLVSGVLLIFLAMRVRQLRTRIQSEVNS